MLLIRLSALLPLLSMSNAGAGWIREIFESLNLLNAATVDSVQRKQTAELQLNKKKMGMRDENNKDKRMYI